MGFFSFLEQETPQDQGPTIEQLGADPNSEAVKGKKLKVDDASLRRSIASKEQEAAKLEQGAIGQVHRILQRVTGPGMVGATNAQLVQVRDAMDKGMLKPHQLVDDLETLLKKKHDPTHITEPEVYGLVSALNDLKVSQQKRAEVQQEGAGLGRAPQISKEDLIGSAEESLAKAKKLREEASNLGVLNRGSRIQQAQNLESQAAGLRGMADEQQETKYAPGVSPTLPASNTPIQDYLKGFGLEQKDLIPRIHSALTVSGITPDKWGDDVDPRSGVLRIMSALDKNGSLANAIAQQLQLARQEDAANKQNTSQQPDDPRIAQTEARIGQREAELRGLYASLRDNDFMRTWPGIILYVLVGLITQNPAFAARLIGGRDNRGAVGAEIKGIQMELSRLDRQLARDIDRDTMAKREAARRLQRKDDQVDQRKWEVSKMMLQHNLIIERNAKKGNPETFMMKKLASEFQRALGMASKYSGEMQNEFADPKARAFARDNFNHYMRKAAELDEDIRNMGGAVLTEEADAGE